jgi:hypothetical protein
VETGLCRRICSRLRGTGCGKPTDFVFNPVTRNSNYLHHYVPTLWILPAPYIYVFRMILVVNSINRLPWGRSPNWICKYNILEINSGWRGPTANLAVLNFWLQNVNTMMTTGIEQYFGNLTTKPLGHTQFSGGIAPHILCRVAWWVSCSGCFLPDRKLGGPQRRSGCWDSGPYTVTRLMCRHSYYYHYYLRAYVLPDSSHSVLVYRRNYSQFLHAMQLKLLALNINCLKPRVKIADAHKFSP